MDSRRSETSVKTGQSENYTDTRQNETLVEHLPK